MSVFLLIFATGVVVWMVVAAARAISAARLDHTLRAEAPTMLDVAAVISGSRAEPLAPVARAVTPQPIPLPHRPGGLRRTA